MHYPFFVLYLAMAAKRNTKVTTRENKSVVFRATKTGNKHWSIQGQYELPSGEKVFYRPQEVMGRHGQLERRGSSISFENGMIKVRTDSDLYAFLKDHPLCEGSELNQSEGNAARFYIVDNEKASREAYEKQASTLKLQNAVLEVGENEARVRQLVLALNGKYDENNKAANMMFLMKQAEINPEGLRTIMEQKDIEPEAVYHAAEQQGIIENTSTGKVWAGQRIGRDSADAIATLRGDEKLLQNIKNNLS